YLNRFKLDSARISKTYSGQQIFYVLEIHGDDIVVEHLNTDKTTVARAFNSAQISLPCDIDESEKALRWVFDRGLRGGERSVGIGNCSGATFSAAMRRAIEKGLEHAPIGVDRRPGTKRPILILAGWAWARFA